MDINQRKNILSYLARKAEGDTAELEAVQKEVKKIAEMLKTETQYDQITDQLGLLATIAYRTHEETVEIILNLVTRLKNIKLTYLGSDRKVYLSSSQRGLGGIW